MKIIHLFRGQVRLDKESGCLLYIGTNTNGKGYPGIRVGSETQLYHRFLYELVHGKLPPKHEVHHTCVKNKCLNLRHLNGLSGKEHRKQHLKTHCKNGHEFTPENTRIKPDGSRKCIICQRAENRKGLRNRTDHRRFRFI
jgi:HNH endonuclease